MHDAGWVEEAGSPNLSGYVHWHYACASCGARQAIHKTLVPAHFICAKCSTEFWASPDGRVRTPEASAGAAPPPPIALGASNASVWRRAPARLLDILLFTPLAAILAAVVLARYYPSALLWIEGRGWYAVWLFVPGFLGLMLDSLVVSIFGNTPGKALFGVGVTDANGARLSFDAHTERNIGFWWFGAALFIPLLYMITLAVQARRIARGEQARYDTGRFFVSRTGDGRAGPLFGSAAILVLLAANGLMQFWAPPIIEAAANAPGATPLPAETLAREIARQHNINSQEDLTANLLSSSATAVANNVRFAYVLRARPDLNLTEMSSFAAATKAEVMPHACKEALKDGSFDRGLFYTFTYDSNHGQRLASFDVDKQLCLGR